MVIVITGLIALVFALLIYFSGGDQGLFWSIITFLVPTLSALITFFAIRRHKMVSTQYLGDYVLEVVHYEPWDELVAFHDYLTGSSSPITKYWVPKDFHDFDYLKVGVSPVVVFVLLAVTVVFCIAMWVVSVKLGITV